MSDLVELMNDKLKEVEAQGDFLYDTGYFPKDSTIKTRYSDSPINTKQPHLKLLFSIIPLIFTPSERKSIGSYGGKHTVEHLMYPGYISNGEFILVMLCLGYKMKAHKDSPNPTFYGQWSKNVNTELKYKFLC